jgi:hypothetical protein
LHREGSLSSAGVSQQRLDGLRLRSPKLPARQKE